MNKKVLKEYVNKFIKKEIIKESISIDPQIQKIKNFINDHQFLGNMFKNISKLNNFNAEEAELIDTKIMIYVGPSLEGDDSFYTLEGNIKFYFRLPGESEISTKTSGFAEIAFEKLPDSRRVYDNEGLERSIFKIYHTYGVKYGLGPLMYDLLIEYISLEGGVLVSDREDVTVAASRVWEKYMRRKDIKQAQTDINLEKHQDKEDYLSNLTYDYLPDDLEQWKSLEYAEENFGSDEYWFDAPFSKGLYKLEEDMKVKKSLEIDKKFILSFE